MIHTDPLPEEMLKEFEIDEGGRKTYPFIVTMEFEHLKKLLSQAKQQGFTEGQQAENKRILGCLRMEWEIALQDGIDLGEGDDPRIRVKYLLESLIPRLASPESTEDR